MSGPPGLAYPGFNRPLAKAGNDEYLRYYWRTTLGNRTIPKTSLGGPRIQQVSDNA